MLVRIIFFLLLWAPISVFSQTFSNGGFEAANSDALLPNTRSQLDRTTAWKPAKDGDLTGGGPHTPDWLSTCSPEHYRFLEEDDNAPGSFNSITANTGCRYGSMAAAEMMQQNIEDQIDEDKRFVHVEMYIRLPAAYQISLPTDTITRVPQFDSGLELNFVMADKEMRYEYPESSCPGINNNLYEKEEDVDAVVVGTIPISVEEYPRRQWHKIEIDFLTPSDNHNWIGFELKIPSTATSCGNDPILIDDVSVTVSGCEICETCDAYDGCIDHTVFNASTVPLTVSGLSNVDSINLGIYTATGVLIRTIAIKSCPQMVSWDGKTDSGNEVAAGTYFYSLYLENSCDRRNFELDRSPGSNRKITKLFSDGDTDADNPYAPINFNAYTMNYNSPGIVTQDIRDQCCYNCLEITPNNIGYLNPPTSLAGALSLLPGSITGVFDTLVIIAIDTIKVNGVTFMDGSCVYLQAGSEIILDHNGGSIMDGAEVECVIEDCTSGFIGDPPSNLVVNEDTANKPLPVKLSKVSIDSSSLGEKNKLEEKKGMDKRIDIYPNPSADGVFNLKIVGYSEGFITINVYDAKGINVFYNTFQGNTEEYLIDLSGSANGFYYIAIRTEDDYKVQKIIKH